MRPSQDLIERVIKSGSIVLFFTFLVSLLGYFIRILYSRSLSIESFGLLYAIIGFFSIFTIYNDLGFGYALSYFVPKMIKNGNKSKVWTLYLYDQIIEIGMSIFISLFLLIFANWIANNYFRNSDAKNIIYIFCIYFIANSFLSAINKFFNGLQMEKYYSSIQFVNMFFILSFSLFFVFIGQKNITYIAIAWSSAYIISSFIYNLLLYKTTRSFKRKFVWDIAIFNKMARYAVPTLLTTSIYSLLLLTDVIFLTLFKGVRDVAIYNIIVPIVSIPLIFLSPINALLFPLISELMEDNKEELKNLLLIILKFVTLIGFYFLFFIFLFPSQSVSILFGQKWVGLVEEPLSILSIGYIFAFTASYLTNILVGMGKIKERLKISVILAIIDLITIPILIFYFGVLGAVVGMSLFHIVSVILLGIMISKELKFNYPFYFYLKILFLGILLFLISRIIGLQKVNLLQFILLGLIYTFLISLLAIYIGIINKKNIKLLLKVFKETVH